MESVLGWNTACNVKVENCLFSIILTTRGATINTPMGIPSPTFTKADSDSGVSVNAAIIPHIIPPGIPATIPINIPRQALVKFASGISLLVDNGMKWEKVSKP